MKLGKLLLITNLIPYRCFKSAKRFIVVDDSQSENHPRISPSLSQRARNLSSRVKNEFKLEICVCFSENNSRLIIATIKHFATKATRAELKEEGYSNFHAYFPPVSTRTASCYAPERGARSQSQYKHFHFRFLPK
jgi:hypothetical protein